MDLFKEIFKFFTDKEYSFISKFIGIIILFTTLFIFDNILGFSFYYSNNQKINQLKTIENLKQDCPNNLELINILDDLEDKIIKRRDLVETFLNLFSKEKFDAKTQASTLAEHDTIYVLKYDTVYLQKNQINEDWKRFYLDTALLKRIYKNNYSLNQRSTPKENNPVNKESTVKIKKENHNMINSRSRIWHTLSSSYFLIALMIFLPLIPLTLKPINWGMFIGMIFFSIICAGLIWLNQFLFGLIPVIRNTPWINYLVNFLIHTLIWMFIGYYYNGKKK